MYMYTVLLVYPRVCMCEDLYICMYMYSVTYVHRHPGHGGENGKLPFLPFSAPVGAEALTPCTCIRSCLRTCMSVCARRCISVCTCGAFVHKDPGHLRCREGISDWGEKGKLLCLPLLEPSRSMSQGVCGSFEVEGVSVGTWRLRSWR